jgi:hypothetical protein
VAEKFSHGSGAAADQPELLAQAFPQSNRLYKYQFFKKHFWLFIFFTMHIESQTTALQSINT